MRDEKSLKTIIGLEIHVQLKTKSKMFCGCDNNAEGKAPNTLVCPICMGYPGTLPKANRQAIEWTLKTGLALNCQIAEFSRFDRKHYFYPDLPKGYQISQYNLPFCTGGYMEIPINRKDDKLHWDFKKIGLERIHLEEDAGKLIHKKDYTLVDLNRAGTPLMEIVTKPEINSPSEAKLFLRMLRSILRYLEVSDADMEKGHLRCDANISIAQIRNPKSEIRNKSQIQNSKLGVPVEIKNLNSFRMVERALAFEEKRQKEILEKGEKIVKETRGWNDAKGETFSQRGKEYAQDYRYFPEPDIPPFIYPKKYFNSPNIQSSIPELPTQKIKKYLDWDKGDQIPLIEIGFLLVEDAKLSSYYEDTKSSIQIHPVSAANFILNILKVENIKKIPPKELGTLIKFVEDGELSGQNAKKVLAIALATGKKVEQIIQEKDMKQLSDENELNIIIDHVILENKKSISDFKAGKKEALGFLVGQVMQKTRGQANPQIVNQILKEKLENF